MSRKRQEFLPISIMDMHQGGTLYTLFFVLIFLLKQFVLVINIIARSDQEVLVGNLFSWGIQLQHGAKNESS